MRATLLYQAGDVRVENVEDPKIQQPTDAVVRIVLASICGSDLWPYKSQPPTGDPRHMGHEFIGVVEETGPGVTGVKPRHALAETYSVLTRLPGDARLAADDAVRLLDARFATPLVLSADHARKVHATLGRIGTAGGAVYDALVALAAREHGAPLATRDARARGTYDAVGVKVIVVP